MRKLGTRIKSILLSITMTIQVFAGVGLFSITAYADTTNADGSITKTATLTNTNKERCIGGTWEYVKTMPASTGTCTNAGSTSTYTVSVSVYKCSKCGQTTTDVNASRCSFGHDHSHDGRDGNHYTYTDCPFEGCSLTTAHYYNKSYGYHGTSSTFKVWPLTVTGTYPVVIAHTQVVGSDSNNENVEIVPTASDAAIAGYTVMIYRSGPRYDGDLIIKNTGLNTTETVANSSFSSYTFTMPAKPTTVTIAPATIDATTSSSITVLDKTYLDADFDVASYFTTNSDGAKTYSSNDTTVATVSGSTVTIKKAGSCTITMNTAATSSYYASSASFTLNVAKATPTLSSITASSITYGQTLASSTVSGVAKVGTKAVAGTWSFNSTSTVPTVADSNSTAYAITFNPTDTNNYNSATGTVKLIVNKASGYITSATASSLTYGQSLSDSILTGQFNKTVPGSFTWNSPSTKPTAGTRSYDWTYKPNDTVNYSTQTGSSSVTIAKASPVVTVNSINPITYGQTLSNATVNGSAAYQGATVTGSFTWQNGSTTKPAVADSGSTIYTLVFQPNDTTNFNSVTLRKTIVVNKAPAIQNPSNISLSSTPITYGQSLAASTITGTPASDVPGSYVWTDSSIVPSVSDSGRSYSVTFVPTDTANYDSITGLSCAITVNKATPVITDDIRNSVTASAITYGESLADSIITGDTPVAGNYTWANPSIKPSVSDSGVTPYDVVFTPLDLVNYNTTTLTATLIVNPAVPVITDGMRRSISASGIIYGDALSASTLTGDMPVFGSYVWDDDSIKPSVSDSDSTPYGVTFVPADDVNYTTVTGLSTTVHVDKATPIVTEDMILTISATAIVYGQTLADSILSGDAPMSGYYEWVDDSIAPTVADSNLTEYDVVFTPDDTDNYNQVTGLKCKLVVTKATPEITDEMRNSIEATAITYGDTLADSTLSGDMPISGRYVWADTSIMPSVADSDVTPYAVVFVPTDTDNYNNAYVSTTLTVYPKTPTVTDSMARSISATDIVYEQTLADSTLSGDTPVPGRYVWDQPDTVPTVADSNSTYYPVSFVPDDNINYTSVSGLSTTLIVTKLAPPITQDILDTVSASDIIYGDSLDESVLTGDTPRDGHWEWNEPDIMPVVSDSNATDYVIKFVPMDTANYDVSYAVAQLTVNPYQPVITEDFVRISEITYGDALADAIISGDMPQLNGSDITGSYAWEDHSITPDAGSHSYNIVFIPDDTNNILSVIFEATVVVNKAVPVISDEIRQSISATDIVYGQTLADSEISGDVPMAGHYDWKYPETAPTVADSNVTPFDVLFVPESSNYTNAELVCTLVVKKKTVTFSQDDINNIVAEDLTYGQLLGESALTGDTPVPGEYHWLDESIKPNVDDENNYPVKFIPDDIANYEIVPVGDVHVNVHKADPTIDVIQLAAITTTPLVYGQTLAQSTIYGEASVPGTFVWVDDTIKPSVADSEVTPYDVTFVPDDINNYNTLPVSATVKVHKAIPLMPLDIDVWLKASSITYGQCLSDSILTYDGNGVVHGEFVWQAPTTKPEMADSDTTDFPVLFVPADPDNYETMSYTSKVHVYKAPAPDNYQNLIDTISVKLGDTIEYQLDNVIHIPEYQIKSHRVSDESSIFKAAPEINGNIVSFNIKDTGSFHDQSAAISFTIESRDYLDFNFTLVINVSDCVHDGMTHIENQRAATCCEEGYTGDKVCDKCLGTIEYGRVIEKTAHKGTVVNTASATCTESGFSGDVVCSVCGALIEHGHTIAPTGHTEGEPVIDVPAAEGSTGIRSYYCITCNKLIRSEVIPALEPTKPVIHVHEYEDVYSFDDCYHWRRCISCGNVIDKGLHDYDDGEYITATCTTEGLVKYTCKTCGAVEIRLETPGHRLSEYKYSGVEHYKECLICGMKFDEHVHVYGDWVVVKSPTGSELGEYRHECSICAYVEVEMAASNPSKAEYNSPEMSNETEDAELVTEEAYFETNEIYSETKEYEESAEPEELEVFEEPSSEESEEVPEAVNDGDDDKSNPHTGSRNTLFSFVAFAIIAGGVMWLLRRRKPAPSSDV